MKTALLWLTLLFWYAAPAAGAAPAEDDYALFRMMNGAVIRMKTGEKGDAVRLLTNPQTMTLGPDTISVTPANPAWVPVPDGSYETAFGTTFVIHDSKIVGVIDRLGTNVTNPR